MLSLDLSLTVTILQVSGSPITRDPNCGISKGCFYDCGNSGCTFFVTWTDAGDDVTFEITSYVSIGTDKWLALGLSNDEYMVMFLFSYSNRSLYYNKFIINSLGTCKCFNIQQAITFIVDIYIVIYILILIDLKHKSYIIVIHGYIYQDNRQIR